MKRAIRIGLGLGLGGAVAAASVASCTTETEEPARDAGAHVPDATTPHRDSGSMVMQIPPDAMAPGSYCSLPGSVVGTANGVAVVAGADPKAPDMSWVRVPEGYCAHHFAHVPETRNLRVGPGGDVFAASPSQPTAGGELEPGLGRVVVLPDDDHDGVADVVTKFLPADSGTLAQVQGLTFANGYLYFQDATSVKRVPFHDGDRAPSGSIETVTTITAQQMPVHWPKVFDVAKDGTLYVTNGSDQGESCTRKPDPIGAVFEVTATGGTNMVAKGFRNPIAIRCEADHDVCLVAELARDGSGSEGGREKLVPVRPGDDWGFPCCAGMSKAYEGMNYMDPNQPIVPVQDPDCKNVTAENVSFQIGHTPFGLDFETGIWTDTWSKRVFVALHGDVGTYIGSRVVAISLDPMTGLPLPSTDLDTGMSVAPNMIDFVTGWDDGRQDHGRATAVAFGADGRLYVGDDTAGEIFWIAPVALMRP